MKVFYCFECYTHTLSISLSHTHTHTRSLALTHTERISNEWCVHTKRETKVNLLQHKRWHNDTSCTFNYYFSNKNKKGNTEKPFVYFVWWTLITADSKNIHPGFTDKASASPRLIRIFERSQLKYLALAYLKISQCHCCVSRCTP